MTKYVLLVVASTGIVSAGLEAPRKGCVVEPGAGVRMVYGVRSNFVLSAPVLLGATAAACSGRFVVAQTGSTLTIFNASGAVLGSREVAGDAIVGFGGDAVYAYAAAIREAWVWRSGEWLPLSIPVDGDILALSGDLEGHSTIVRREDGVWLVRFRERAIMHQERLADRATGAVLWSDGALLLAEAATLRFRTPNSIERVHDTGSPVRSLSAMSDGWVQVETENRRLALECAPDGERIYVLPGAAP